MTVYSFLANQTKTIVAATFGDRWVIETGVTVKTTGLAIDASGLATGRELLIKGSLISTNGTGLILGDKAVADSDTTIKIDDAARFVSGGKGIVAAGGGLDFNNVGVVKSVLDTLSVAGTGNRLINNDSMMSTAGHVIVSAGSSDVIINNGALSAHGIAIKSSGARAEISNNLEMVSLAGQGIVSTGRLADITNAGTITAALNGVELRGDHASLVNYKSIASQTAAGVRSKADDTEITNHTAITGKTAGVFTSGDDAIVINKAKITSEGVAIRSTGDGADITNNATLKAAVAILSSGGDARVENTHVMSSLSLGDAAVQFTSSGISHLVNAGEIHAKSGLVISGGAGRELIRNTGWLDGNVTLGNGNDLFDNRGGQITGKVAGGKGNDTYVIDHWIGLVEKHGGGIDTVKSSVSYALGDGFENLILFGSAKASATGNALDNRITGNGAANVMTGGEGEDVFVFRTGAGNDRIADFEDGIDRIDVSKVAGIGGFADIKAHMTASHGSVVIDFAGLEADLKITLADVHIKEIGASDFLF